MSLHYIGNLLVKVIALSNIALMRNFLHAMLVVLCYMHCTCTYICVYVCEQQLCCVKATSVHKSLIMYSCENSEHFHYIAVICVFRYEYNFDVCTVCILWHLSCTFMGSAILATTCLHTCW